MTGLTFSNDKLHALADIACDGTLAERDFSQLEQLLIGNSEAQQYYLTHVCLDRWLRWEFSRESHEPALPQPAPVLGFLSTTLHGTLGYFSSGWPVAYLVATMIFAVGLLVGAFTSVSELKQIATKSSTPAIPLTKSGDEFVGRITGMADCRWAGAAVDSARVTLGQKFKLTSGLMEITYDTGAKVILQGPASFEVESTNSGFLSIGRLTGKVEVDKAKGFSVHTPTATVTDLGTEFGVEVDQEGRTDSHVFSGRVKVAWASRGWAEQETRLLQAGQAGHFDGKTAVFTMRPIDDQRFVRAVRPQRANAFEAYGKFVLSLHPAVYYRMEWPTDEKNRSSVFDLASGGHHGLLSVDKAFMFPPRVSGRFGGATMLFRGPMVGEHAMVPDYPKAEHDQLSVSAWVMASGRPLWGMIVANMGETVGGQFHFGCYDRDGDLGARINQRDTKLGCAELREGRDKPLPLGIWQHVAFIADGATARLYRNGVEVASVACDGILCPPGLRSLTIGCKTNEPFAGHSCHWHGCITELAIFNRALSAEDIRQLAAIAPVGAGSQVSKGDSPIFAARKSGQSPTYSSPSPKQEKGSLPLPPRLVPD